MEKKEVTKLLFDLKEHFAKMPADEPYYLGMLTCIDMKNHYDLIDGQQRFTVMTLLPSFLRNMMINGPVS